MTANFNINTDFKTLGFDNAIDSYNQNFSNSINQANKNLDSNMEFDKIFNSMTQATQTQPIQAGTQYFVGMDSINSQKIETSPVAKMAQDIGNGFSDSIKNLNAVERKAEADFEKFASGGDISIHDVMISSQKSGLAMQMAIQLRNQMLNAYNEFKNMSI